MDWRIVSYLDACDASAHAHLRTIAFGVGKPGYLWSVRAVLAAMARGDRFYTGAPPPTEATLAQRCECVGRDRPHVRLPGTAPVGRVDARLHAVH